MPPMGGPHGRNAGLQKPKNAKQTLTKILKYIGKNKVLLLLVLLMLIFSTLCSTGASYWLKPILNGIENSIKAGDFATAGVKQLAVNLAIVSAFYIGASLFSFIQSKIMVKIAYKTTNII